MNAEPSPAATLAVSMGDPRGIGPEVAVKALASGELPGDVRLRIVGAADVLGAAARLLGLPEPAGDAVVDLANFPVDRLEPREPDAAAGRASLDYIEEAVAMVRDGRADALVTGPINKESIAAAGSPYPGHTEMLAGLTGAGRSVMMLVNSGLRVAQVTTHLALRDVPDAVTEDEIVATAGIVAEGLQQHFGIDRPRIALCGLNPHCSDGGRFGDEEARVLEPAVVRARAEGLDLQGPCPADTVFVQAMAGRYDAVIAMYHDQGMIPVKLAGLGEVVNVTLGLPIIRTSVGHGTAFDIAGTGRADESSLLAAIRLARDMAVASRAEP